MWAGEHYGQGPDFLINFDNGEKPKMKVLHKSWLVDVVLGVSKLNGILKIIKFYLDGQRL